LRLQLVVQSSPLLRHLVVRLQLAVELGIAHSVQVIGNKLVNVCAVEEHIKEVLSLDVAMRCVLLAAVQGLIDSHGLSIELNLRLVLFNPRVIIAVDLRFPQAKAHVE
jgi:hypothetical protein